MFLKSQGFASNLSDPERHAHAGGLLPGAPAARTRATACPVPLDTFVAYGQWFRTSSARRRRGAGHRRRRQRRRIRAHPGQLRAGRGPARWSSPSASSTSRTCPAPLSALPASVCTHSSAHTDLAAFARPGRHRRRRRPVGAGVGRAAARERRRPSRSLAPEDQPSPGTGCRWRRTGRCAQRLQGARVRARLGLGHLVLLQPPGPVPAPAARTRVYRARHRARARPGPAGCAAGSRASSRSADRPVGRSARAQDGSGAARCSPERRPPANWPPTTSSRPPATAPT